MNTTGTYRLHQFMKRGMEWNTRWMHDIVGQAWVSPRAECGPVACMHMTAIRMWLNLRPQNITKSTHVYNTGTVSQA